MNILFLGDVVGRSGRDALAELLSRVRIDLNLDFVVVNAENATAGAGLSIDHAKYILSLGVYILIINYIKCIRIQNSEKIKKNYT